MNSESPYNKESASMLEEYENIKKLRSQRFIKNKQTRRNAHKNATIRLLELKGKNFLNKSNITGSMLK